MNDVNTSGFLPLMVREVGAYRALEELQEARSAIVAAVPRASLEDINKYLASEFGERTAEEVLAGRSVNSQLEFRLQRFLRNFAVVQRRG